MREGERETKRERERERDNKYIFGHMKKIEVNRFSSKIVLNIKYILSVYNILYNPLLTKWGAIERIQYCYRNIGKKTIFKGYKKLFCILGHQ